MLNKDQKHPMQPIGWDGTTDNKFHKGGRVRFKRNAIISAVFDDMARWTRPDGGFDYNKLAVDIGMNADYKFERQDYEQLMQLIGYSVGGYCELSGVSEESKDAAWAIQESLEDIE